MTCTTISDLICHHVKSLLFLVLVFLTYSVGSLDNTSNPSMNTDYEVIQDFSGVIVLLSGF